MMYYVYRPINWDYCGKEQIEIAKCDDEVRLGQVSEVYFEENKFYLDPLEAARAALSIQKQWYGDHPDTGESISIVVGNAVPEDAEESGMILKTKFASKLMKWANREYSSLPKCKSCRGILGKQNHNHRLQNDRVFCSELCAARDLEEQIVSLNDNEETEFFLD